MLPKPILRRNAVLLTVWYPLGVRVFTHLRLKILSIRKLVPLNGTQTVRTVSLRTDVSNIVLRNATFSRVPMEVRHGWPPKMLEVAIRKKLFRLKERKKVSKVFGQQAVFPRILDPLNPRTLYFFPFLKYFNFFLDKLYYHCYKIKKL